MRRVIWVLIVAAILGVAAWTLRPQPLPVVLGSPERRVVHEYIAEEAKTRLAKEYTVDMPIAGTLQRITWDVGDLVEKGAVLAQIDPYNLEQQISGAEALIVQAKANIEGVDATKTKSEEVDAAAVRVQEAQDALSIAEKERRIAEIDYTNATREYERMNELVGEGVASRSQFDQAERTYFSAEQNVARARLAVDAARRQVEVADLLSKGTAGSVDDNEFMRQVYQAEVDRLEAQLRVLRSDLEKTTVRAPVGGPILEKYVDHRAVLPPGRPLIKLGDLATMEIESDVLSEEVVRVSPGDAVEIIGKALQKGEAATNGDAPFVDGTVKRIYPSAFRKISSLGIEQQRVKVLIDYDSAATPLRAGTRLDVRIITNANCNALAVPERCTFRQEGQWYVFRVEDGRAVRTAVTVGLKNDEWAEIVEGLSDGGTIIVEPGNDLEDGAAVVAK